MGFDQPRLCAMYVNRRLGGVQAVQTLSRLNRIYPGKEAPFILDFVNDEDSIYDAFKAFYSVTQLEEPADPQQMENLKHELDKSGVYYWQDVEEYKKIFYKPKNKQSPSDHAKMQKYIQPAVDRFNQLDEDHKENFYSKLVAFIRLYAFLSQIMPYTDEELEMLYSYGRGLIVHLHPGDIEVTPHPEKDVALEYYRTEVKFSGSINLEEGENMGLKGATDVGTGKSKDEDKPLSELVQTVNDRFGTDFTEEDRLFFEQIEEKACMNEFIIETAKSNKSFDKFILGIERIIGELMRERLKENHDIVQRYSADKDFGKFILSQLAQSIFRRLSR